MGFLFTSEFTSPLPSFLCFQVPKFPTAYNIKSSRITIRLFEVVLIFSFSFSCPMGMTILCKICFMGDEK